MDGSAQLTEVRFTTKKRGGYDPDEVDNFLDRVGERVFGLQEKVRAAEQRAEKADARATDLEGRLAASGDASGATASPRDLERETSVAEMEETLKKALVLAQRTADETVKEAEEQARTIVSEAEARAGKVTDKADTEAKRRLDAAQEPIRTEVVRLEKRKRELESSIVGLNERVQAEKARLHRALDALRGAIEGTALDARDDGRPAPATDTGQDPAGDRVPAPAPASSSGSPRPPAAPAGPSRRVTPPQPERANPVAIPSSTVGGPTPAPSASTPPAPATPPPAPSPSPAAPVSAATPPRATAGDGGPPTQAIDLTPSTVDDSSFLAELRQAVADAPPDTPADPAPGEAEAMNAFFDQADAEPARRRHRFGRRH